MNYSDYYRNPGRATSSSFLAGDTPLMTAPEPDYRPPATNTRPTGQRPDYSPYLPGRRWKINAFQSNHYRRRRPPGGSGSPAGIPMDWQNQMPPFQYWPGRIPTFPYQKHHSPVTTY